ncbi:hypothetical protein PRZ48_007901 [Zasmidium cellare]|uniref:Uncharacterized protein n=1 Tax=Zasmidium cellare TaxID=395010 RepID=A0ABR0ELG8_ZASCE|nr:hypothetical protein PRZ48_007901 [Zasmidium cellare]
MSIPEDAKHFKDVEDQAYDGYDFYPLPYAARHFVIEKNVLGHVLVSAEVINRMVEEPRRPVTLSMRDFTTDLAPGKNRDSNDIALDRSSLEQLSQIVADMTGETLPSEAPAPRDHPARTTFDDDLSGLFDLSGL